MALFEEWTRDVGSSYERGKEPMRKLEEVLGVGEDTELHRYGLER